MNTWPLTQKEARALQAQLATAEKALQEEILRRKPLYIRELLAAAEERWSELQAETLDFREQACAANKKLQVAEEREKKLVEVLGDTLQDLATIIGWEYGRLGGTDKESKIITQARNRRTKIEQSLTKGDEG